MSFFQVVYSNIVNVFFNVIFILWISRYLLKRIPSREKGFLKIIIITILFIIMIAVIGAIFFKKGLFRWEYHVGQIFFIYIMLIAEMIFLKILYKESLLNCWLLAIFFEMIECFSTSIAFFASPESQFNLEILSERIFYFFFLFGVSPLTKIMLILVLKKAQIGEIIQQWFDQKKFQLSTIIFLSLYPILMEGIGIVIEFSDKRDAQTEIVSIIYLLIVCIIFNYIVREEQQRMQLETQQISMKQQRTYIKSLEELQKEMRRFRHDYKNMMSGMYLQAKVGDMEALQNFIQDMTEDFDHQVGGQIRRLTQLANIHMLEVKGLLLGKLEEMQKEQIDCELEVLRPFYKTSLRSTDLCRCLGILIDNAIEEVRGKEKPRIHIMISSQEGYTTFRIKNILYSTIDFHKIWTQGYSTKGNDRGIGLASYKKILERYENIMPFTTIRDGYFIQELKVQEEK